MSTSLRCLSCHRKVSPTDLAAGNTDVCLRCIARLADSNGTRPPIGVDAYLRKWNADRLLARVRKYGLTMAQYEAMRKACDYSCEICGTRETADHQLHIDHCHATGRVRGLLCPQCNQGLGNFKDNVDAMATAIAYLKR